MIRSTVCITEYRDRIVSWLDVDSRMERLSVARPDEDITGNIYVGTVKHVVKNLDACFVEFDKDTLGFLSFNDVYPKMRITEGMQVTVQVVKEASKKKEAVLTMKLSIPGDYCVAIYDDKSVNVSRKITGDDRSRLREAFPKEIDLSFTIRTNAAGVSDMSLITDEANRLSDKLHNILDISNMRKAPALCYESDKDHTKFLQSLYAGSYDRVLTDIKEIYEELKDRYPCELYDDEYPLSKLYSLETKMDELLSSRVWLKSGGNILIEYTEAMTVIDVNSAKNLAGKDREVNVLNINKEAACQIARQLRLRNISGIIIVDFINMQQENSKAELAAYLRSQLQADPVRCDYVDMTSLGLVEIVRRKIKPPIYEIMSK